MKKFFKKLLLILLCVISINFVGCNQKINIEDTSVVEELKTNIEYIDGKYYNKYNDKVFLTDDVKDLYVKVADGLRTAFRVSFGSVVFDNKQKVKFNIGNNSYIYTLAFYKKDKSLYVFSPLLAIESGQSNVLLFCVDKMYFSVKTYMAKSELKYINASDLSGRGELLAETNNADRLVITHKVNDSNDLLGIDLQKNGNQLNENHLFFIRKSYQAYSHPTEYIFYKKAETGSDVVIEYKDILTDLNKGNNVYMDIKITSFGGGQVEFDLNVSKK